MRRSAYHFTCSESVLNGSIDQMYSDDLIFGRIASDFLYNQSMVPMHVSSNLIEAQRVDVVGDYFLVIFGKNINLLNKKNPLIFGNFSSLLAI